MSPHATQFDSNGGSPTSFDETLRHGHRANGSTAPAEISLLRRCGIDEIHDLICVGFGPASLAIAVALHDSLEQQDPGLRTKHPKVRFLERQPHFAWHAGMLLPGAKMQITFIKDLATMRNPRSNFTFLNYLSRKGRLAAFTNVGTFLPQRMEYEDYMRWSADHFNDVVDYAQDVHSVDVGRRNAKTRAVEYFQVRSLDQSSGQATILHARHVVIAVGGKPNLPKCLDAGHPRVIHSSQYATSISHIFPPGTQPRSVAVIGAGQSAAEIFHNIPVRFPGTKAYLLIKGAALRPSDDSPFVNEIFDPEKVDDVYSQKPDVRAEGLALDKGTNYGVVRLELLEEIYAALYTYRIQYKNEQEWPQQILAYRTVTGMSEPTGKSNHAVRLHIQDDSGTYEMHKDSRTETLDVDLVVVASGYRRDAHEDMLKGVRHLMPNRGAIDERWTVSRDYDVQFAEDVVGDEAGVWLQGCNESTHGLSDTLLSILATRGGEMVQHIFG